MKTHLEFKSSYFQIIPGEDDDVNEGIYGKHLAQFMTEQLNANGYNTRYIAEDWGWCVLIDNPFFESFVGCSSYGEEGEWLIQIEPYKPIVRKWFKKIDTTAWVEKLSSTVEHILVEQGEAVALRWWSDAESGRK
jgi:hypothetical protein